MKRGAVSLLFLLVFCAVEMGQLFEAPLEGFKVEFVKHDIPTEMMRDYCHDQEWQFQIASGNGGF